MGVASFVFSGSLRVWGRVDRRLQLVQAWRSTALLIERDLASFERVNALADPVASLKIKRVDRAPSAIPDPALRADRLTFVTHHERDERDALCQVTYWIDDTRRGLQRSRTWLKRDAAGKVVVDGGAEAVEVYPGASGFAVRWYARNAEFGAVGRFVDPDLVEGANSTANGERFYVENPPGSGKLDPAALELTLFVEEQPGKPDSGKLTLSKVFALP